jgi:hypothetical protein
MHTHAIWMDCVIAYEHVNLVTKKMNETEYSIVWVAPQKRPL